MDWSGDGPVTGMREAYLRREAHDGSRPGRRERQSHEWNLALIPSRLDDIQAKFAMERGAGMTQEIVLRPAMVRWDMRAACRLLAWCEEPWETAA